jgi:glycine/D-amino acid oxidase-like deaminating enzyme
MGKVPGTKNVYVATGHSCWGILNAPASGAAMAELIADGKVTVVPGFERFAPRRAT